MTACDDVIIMLEIRGVYLKNLLAAQEFFKDDRFQKLVGVNIEEVGDGYAGWGVNLDENHFNADGIVQGGVIYTLADSAFAVAANSGEFFTVTLSSSVQYLQKTTGRYIRAKAVRVGESKKVCFYRVDVTDEAGRLVAVADMTGYTRAR